MLSKLLTLSKTINTCLKTWLQNRFVIALLLTCLSVLVVLSCPPILVVLRFFFPLILSTAICFPAVYQFILSEKQGGRGILAVQGGEDEDSKGEAQHYDVLTFCTSADHFEVECIQIDSLDGNNILTQKVVLMEGKVERRKEHEHDGGCEEKLSSQVDSLAEGVWNCYFGRYSRWHHKGGDVQG